jgi:hypothetical protein
LKTQSTVRQIAPGSGLFTKYIVVDNVVTVADQIFPAYGGGKEGTKDNFSGFNLLDDANRAWHLFFAL